MAELILPDALADNKILLAVCGGGNVPFGFVTQLAVMAEQLGKLPLVAVEGSYVHRNRTVAAKIALQHAGWDYLLFLDPDMTFPEDLVARVRRYRDPIVGGLYFAKTFPDYGPVCRILEDVDECRWRVPTREETDGWLERPGLHDVDGLGTGCLAIRRDVFAEWPADLPPFDTILAADGNDFTTEDAYFCWRAKQQGIQPKLDSAIVCGHVGKFVVDQNVYRASPELAQVG